MAATAAALEAEKAPPSSPLYPEQLAANLNVTTSNLKYRFYELLKEGKLSGSYSVSTPLSIEQQKALSEYFTKPKVRVSQPVSQSVSSESASQSVSQLERNRASELASELELAKNQLATASQSVSQLELERNRASELASELELVKTQLATASQSVSQLELERNRARELASQLELAKTQLATASQSVSELTHTKSELKEAKQTIKQLGEVKTELATTKVRFESASKSASELELVKHELELTKQSASKSANELELARRELELVSQSASESLKTHIDKTRIEVTQEIMDNLETTIQERVKTRTAYLAKQHSNELQQVRGKHNVELTEANLKIIRQAESMTEMETTIAALDARLKVEFVKILGYKIRVPSRLEIINIVSNVLGCIGLTNLLGVFGFGIWAIFALFFWDTAATVKDHRNKKSAKYGFWITSVLIEGTYFLTHPTTISSWVKGMDGLIATPETYGWVGSIVITIMSVIAINQSMNKAKDRAS